MHKIMPQTKFVLQAEMLAYLFLLVLLAWRVASVVGEWSGSTAYNMTNKHMYINGHKISKVYICYNIATVHTPYSSEKR